MNVFNWLVSPCKLIKCLQAFIHHMHYLLASGMKKITTSIFILLFWLKICTASEFERQSKVGHLIKSGKLFLLHSNKTQKDRDTERDDYQLHSTAGRNITPIIYRTHSKDSTLDYFGFCCSVAIATNPYVHS